MRMLYILIEGKYREDFVRVKSVTFYPEAEKYNKAELKTFQLNLDTHESSQVSKRITISKDDEIFKSSALKGGTLEYKFSNLIKYVKHPVESLTIDIHEDGTKLVHTPEKYI